MSWLIVFLGGGLGSIARFALSRTFAPRPGTLPIATLLANVLACVVMGGFLVLFASRLGASWRLFVITGFCGGFSTFSTFSLETLQLFRGGHAGLALLNIGLNFALCVAVLWVWLRADVR